MAHDVPWLVLGEPREVQLEALRRSYYGVATMEGKDKPIPPRRAHPGPGPAVCWAHFLEMRLGKTPTTLNEFLLLERDGAVDKLIVISPNSYKEEWAAEAQKFMPWVPFTFWTSGKAKTADEFVKKNSKGPWGVSVNYEALNTEAAEKFLTQHIGPRTLLVFDESIKLKNPQSAVSNQAVRLSGAAGFVRELTGLPLTQGPQDLYQQFKALRIMNGINFYSFRNKFCKMGGYMNKKVVGVREDSKRGLQTLKDSISFTAKRKDWGNVTVPEFYPERVPMLPAQQAAYKQMNQEMVLMLEQGDRVTAEMVVTKAMKLQQISSGFVMDENAVARPLVDPATIPKVVRLREMLEDQIEGKVVVPFHFGYSGNVLLEQFADMNPATIRGKAWMHKFDRDAQAEKRRFNTDPNCRVIFVNITAAKYGHDLSGVDGDRCGHMLFYENNYSLDDRTQIEMRNVTANHDWVNVYIDFISSQTDAAVVKALVEKLNIAEAIMGSYGERVRHTPHQAHG